MLVEPMAHVTFARYQEAATKAIPYPFALAKHFHAKNAEGEASNKYANLQSEYAGNLAKIKTLKQHCHRPWYWRETYPSSNGATH